MHYTSFINKMHISNKVAVLTLKYANQSQLLTPLDTHRIKMHMKMVLHGKNLNTHRVLDS